MKGVKQMQKKRFCIKAKCKMQVFPVKSYFILESYNYNYLKHLD